MTTNPNPAAGATMPSPAFTDALGMQIKLLRMDLAARDATIAELRRECTGLQAQAVMLRDQIRMLRSYLAARDATHKHIADQYAAALNAIRGLLPYAENEVHAIAELSDDGDEQAALEVEDAQSALAFARVVLAAAGDTQS